MGRAVAVVGLGYVGLPLAVLLSRSGARVFGYDISESKIQDLRQGKSHVEDVSDQDIQQTSIEFVTDLEKAADLVDTFLVCVPSPLVGKEPDYSYVEKAFRTIQNAINFCSPLQATPLVSLESTVGPGTTKRLQLLMEKDGDLILDRDFHLAFSPERVDPRNASFTLDSIPKVVGGVSEKSGQVAKAFYSEFFQHVHLCPSSTEAELAKLWENSFRMVNIAFAQEMDNICRNVFDVDTREVLKAAATKPFGFMPFSPGAGAGGHCIPVDPLYLQRHPQVRSAGFESQVLGAALSHNEYWAEDEIPSRILNEVLCLPQSVDSRVLVVGVTYKPGVSDIRESRPLSIYQTLRNTLPNCRYHDPLVPRLSEEDESADPDFADYDIVIPLLLQTGVDFEKLLRESRRVLNPATLPGLPLP